MVQTLVGLLIVTMNKTNTYHPQEEFLKQIIVTTIIHIISFILTEQVWVALISDSANKNKPWCNWVDIWFLDVRCYFLSVLCFHFPNKASKMVGCLGGKWRLEVTFHFLILIWNQSNTPSISWRLNMKS